MDHLFRVRTQWMMDNQPALVKEWLEQGNLLELRDSIVNQMYNAHLFAKKLEARGYSQPEAEDESVRAVLAPAMEWGQEEPEPLSEKDQERVWSGLERILEEEEEEEEAEQEK